MKPATGGFTLIELMVTMAILALLASVALPLAELSVQRNKESDLRLALRQIREAIDTYKQVADEGRIVLRPGDSGYPRTLAELVSGVEDAKSPMRTRIYFLRRIPRDPFAAPNLSDEETWGKRCYRSSRTAPQPGEDVFDVYSQSREIGLNGVPYREW